MSLMIALIRVNSLVDFESYRAKVPATLEPYGGEIKFRAKNITTLVDENELGGFSQIALLRFPSQDDMNDWYASDAYQNLTKLRTSAGSFTMLGFNSC
ncbi:MAG: hypothetical protein CMD54_03100 [Gammaproteobacteria bacterium]|nr:hypothetical protein [Gammaproteobacteria bacterium]